MTHPHRIYQDIVQTVGRTPLVRLRRVIDPALATVYLKCEFFNPMSSVKDRIGMAMIDAAERQQLINTNTQIVEPTSGNTGIALAFVCAARGYALTLTMPESMSLERRALLRAMGASLVLTPREQGMAGAIEAAEKIVADTPGAWMPQQFENPANPAIHESTTGPEIWADTDGDLDAIVTGVGTGGSITGITRHIRQRNPNFLAFAVEPAESPVISGDDPGPHEIQGIGAGFIPRNLDTALLDGVVKVSSDEAIEWARRIAREEGIAVGISTGANVCGVIKAIEKYSLHGRRIVTIAASAGERYLSTRLYADAMADR